MDFDEMEPIEQLIVSLNRYKRKRPDSEDLESLNTMQRRLEAEAGVMAIELDDVYGFEG